MKYTGRVHDIGGNELGRQLSTHIQHAKTKSEFDRLLTDVITPAPAKLDEIVV